MAIKCKKCSKANNIENMVRALKKAGFKEQGNGDGTINADIILRMGFLGGRRYFVFCVNKTEGEKDERN